MDKKEKENIFETEIENISRPPSARDWIFGYAIKIKGIKDTDKNDIECLRITYNLCPKHKTKDGKVYCKLPIGFCSFQKEIKK